MGRGMKDMCLTVNSNTSNQTCTESRWYALKVFYNKVFDLRDTLAARVEESYIPVTTSTVERGGVKKQVERPLISSLMFIRTTPEAASSLRPLIEGKAMLYTSMTPQGRRPVAIPDREMNIFMLVTSRGEWGVEYIGDDMPHYHSGDRVRVIEGPFKGSEGHIVRIKGDHRLVVTVNGLCAVATRYMPRPFLQQL